MCGITPYHIRALCDNHWEGGLGQDPNDVGNMTLDQIFMMLTDKKFIRKDPDHRAARLDALETGALADKDGVIKGRAADGTPIKGRIAGKSLARQIAERDAEDARRRDAAAKTGQHTKSQTDADRGDETPRQRRARHRAKRRAHREARG